MRRYWGKTGDEKEWGEGEERNGVGDGKDGARDGRETLEGRRMGEE